MTIYLQTSMKAEVNDLEVYSGPLRIKNNWVSKAEAPAGHENNQQMHQQTSALCYLCTLLLIDQHCAISVHCF